MPIIGSYILPHPPFCVPEVGRGKEKSAEKTVAALDFVAKEIASLDRIRSFSFRLTQKPIATSSRFPMGKWVLETFLLMAYLA